MPSNNSEPDGYADAIDPQEARNRFSLSPTIERTILAIDRWRAAGRTDLVRKGVLELARYGVTRHV